MAKYNMFLGKARGSVGDVVFSMYNGQQVARSRNRAPRNPNSPAQRIQRAVMASVMQAYSAGKSILDHSFEGYSVGLQNMRRFLKLNTDSLRAAVLADLAAGRTGAACQARVTGRGVNAFVPWTFVVSEGSLSQNAFNSSLQADSSYELEAWLNDNNIRKDDIFTLLVYQCLSPDTQYNTLYTAPGATDYYGKVGRCKFSYLQLKVKDLSSLTDEQLETSVQRISYQDIFDVVAMDGISFYGLSNLSDGVLIGDTLPLEGSYYASGVIRSRESSGQRSNCVLEFPTYINEWAAEFGLTSDWINTAWDQDAVSADVEPDLILEGSNFNLAPAVVRVIPPEFSGAQYLNANLTLTAWPASGSSAVVTGRRHGNTERFRILVDYGFTTPVDPESIDWLELKIGNDTAEFTLEGVEQMDEDHLYFWVAVTLPSSGNEVFYTIFVDGTQQGGSVVFNNFAA